jgi:ssDNA-binding Zn-finger/Zn-ribbon topoisomerase 1
VGDRSKLVFTITCKCPNCGEHLTVKLARPENRKFIGCTGYPACHFTSAYDPLINSLGHQLESLADHVAEVEGKLEQATKSPNYLALRRMVEAKGGLPAARGHLKLVPKDKPEGDPNVA